jgi:hypothetical protein
VRRGILIGLAIGAVAIVALVAGAVLWTSTRPPSASDVVRAYFAALADGDADAALAATTLPDEAADRAAEAYAAVQTPISDARVTSAQEDSGAASIAVAYALGGSERETTLQLTSEGARGWRITDGTANLVVSTSLGEAVRIGELSVPGGTDLALLPGRYEVEAAPRGLLEGSTTVDLEPGAAAEAPVTASLTPEAAALAQEQVDAYAEACATASSSVPANCGIRVPWAADLATVSRIAFRIEQRPVVALAADGRTFAATGGAIVATVTGTTRDGVTAGFTYRADDWALRGTISYTADEMVLGVG